MNWRFRKWIYFVSQSLCFQWFPSQWSSLQEDRTARLWGRRVPGRGGKVSDRDRVVVASDKGKGNRVAVVGMVPVLDTPDTADRVDRLLVEAAGDRGEASGRGQGVDRADMAEAVDSRAVGRVEGKGRARRAAAGDIPWAEGTPCILVDADTWVAVALQAATAGRDTWGALEASATAALEVARVVSSISAALGAAAAGDTSYSRSLEDQASSETQTPGRGSDTGADTVAVVGPGTWCSQDAVDNTVELEERTSREVDRVLFFRRVVCRVRSRVASSNLARTVARSWRNNLIFYPVVFPHFRPSKSSNSESLSFAPDSNTVPRISTKSRL